MNRIFLLGTAGAIALVVGGRMALSKQPNVVLAGQSSPTPSTPSPVVSLPIPQVNASPASPQASPTPTYISKQIGTCGSNNNANFRAYPSLDPRSILGVVVHGDTVKLTGRRIQGDGIDWYESIAPELYPSLDAGAQNKLDEGQTGWIAVCFLQN